MITPKDLQEAIAYYNGKIEPNPQDAIILAACYILQDHMLPQERQEAQPYSFAIAPPETQYGYSSAAQETIGEYGNSDFLQAVSGKSAVEAWAIMDDLMDTLGVTNPRAYEGVMREIRKL